MLDYVKDRLNPPLRNARIVFLHVPKCGGTSLIAALDACMKPWRATQRGSILHLNEPAAREARQATRISYGVTRRLLLAYHLATTDARLVHGHYRYSRATFERHRDRWSFITLLRHPIDRWLSNYYFNATLPEGVEYRIEAPLRDHLASEQGMRFGTALVRSFADLDDSQDPRSDEAVDRAITNLRELDLVGTLEDLPAFQSAFEARFDYSLDIPRLNTTSERRKPPPDIEPDIAEEIRQLCEPDLRVFRALFPAIASNRDSR